MEACFKPAVLRLRKTEKAASLRKWLAALSLKGAPGFRAASGRRDEKCAGDYSSLA